MVSADRNVAVLGTGEVAHYVALMLTKSYNVAVYNPIINPTESDEIVAAKAKSASSPPEAARGATIILCLFDADEEAQQCLLHERWGVVSSLLADSIVVLSGRISLRFLRSVEFHVRERGNGSVVLDCPFIRCEHLGHESVQPGIDMLVSGAVMSQHAFRAEQFLKKISTGIQKISGVVGDARKTAIVIHQLQTSNVAIMIEVMGFGLAIGLDLNKMMAALRRNGHASWALQGLPVLMNDQEITEDELLSELSNNLEEVLAQATNTSFPLLFTMVVDQALRAYNCNGIPKRNGVLSLFCDGELDMDVSISSIPSAQPQYLHEHRVTVPDANSPEYMPVYQLFDILHLCSVAEAMSFGAHIGLETSTLLKILDNSVASNNRLVECGERMMSQDWDGKKSASVHSNLMHLDKCLGKMRRLHYLGPLAATAFTILQMVPKALEGRHDACVVRVWERLGDKSVKAAMKDQIGNHKRPRTEDSDESFEFPGPPSPFKIDLIVASTPQKA